MQPPPRRRRRLRPPPHTRTRGARDDASTGNDGAGDSGTGSNRASDACCVSRAVEVERGEPRLGCEREKRRRLRAALPEQSGDWQSIAQPILVVRCEAGRMQTFVYTASALQMEAIDENHAVKISFDGEPEANERWADSSEHDALFAPDAAAFTRRLAASQTLKVSYTPHNASRVVAQFQTHGLSELIEPAAKQCGWKK